MSVEGDVFQAKLAEQAERYDEMVEAMKKVAESGHDMSTEERNLLSVAYKNAVGARRASWRVISSIEQKEEENGSANLGLVKEYKTKIEEELQTMCNSVLTVLTDHCLPNSSNDEGSIFYHKMQGDYHRYLAETATGDKRTEAADAANTAYQAASDLAAKSLKTTNPIRLGLALNFSVFHYEIVQDKQRAVDEAKKAFDSAIADLDSVGEDSYKDSTLIMQLLRDNLTLWTSEDDQGDDN